MREGKIFPASFADKGPEEVLRHARIFGGHEEVQYHVFGNSDKEVDLVGTWLVCGRNMVGMVVGEKARNC